MKYLGEENQVQIKIVSERPIKYVRCEKCNKKIIPHKFCEVQNQYVHIHTHHHDWGNDSVESHEYHDYCVQCAKDVVIEYIENMHGTEELEIINSYIMQTSTYRGTPRSSDGYKLASDDNL